MLMLLLVLLKLVALLTLGDVGCGAEQTFVEEDGVLVLDEHNFNDAIHAFPELFVEFYAPWCGHCKELAPIYAETARALKESRPSTRLAKVDATENKKLAELFGVKSFPTLKLFLGGRTDKPIVFDGDRKVAFFVRWLKKKTTSSPADTIETTDALWDLVNRNTLVALGFFKDRGSAGAKAFIELATENDHYSFAFAAGNQIHDELKVSNDRVVIFKQFDEGRAELKGSVTSASLRAFLNKHRFPLVTSFDWDVSRYLYGGTHIERFLLFFVDKTSAQFQTLIDGIRPVALAFQGQIMLIYIDIASEEFGSRMTESFGVAMSECPAIIYYDKKEDRKYKLTGDSLTWITVRRFVQDAIDGKIAQFYKSEMVPTDWNSKPVKVLVGKTFNDVALDRTKNVFVKFYAPWCGHCKTLAPIWEELAVKYQHQSDLIIAKIDATANDVDGISVHAFPTLIYFPRGGGQSVEYKGDMTLENLSKFINNGGKITEEVKKDTKSEL